MNPWWAPVPDSDPPDGPELPWVEDLERHPSLDVQRAAKAVLRSPTEDAWDLLEAQVQAWESQFPQRCACGLSHDERGWERLQLVDTIALEWDEVLELRRCPCGAALSVTLAEGDHELELELADIARDPDAYARAVGWT